MSHPCEHLCVLDLSLLLAEKLDALAGMWTGFGTPSWTTWHPQLAAMALPCRSLSAACGPSKSTCQRAGQAHTCRALTSARRTCAWRPACTTSSQPCRTSRFVHMLLGGTRPGPLATSRRTRQYQQISRLTTLRDSNGSRDATTSPSLLPLEPQQSRRPSHLMLTRCRVPRILRN